MKGRGEVGRPRSRGGRLALDKGLEQARVYAFAAQAAGAAFLVPAHDADHAAQRVAEGTAEHRSLVFREVRGRQGAEGER